MLKLYKITFFNFSYFKQNSHILVRNFLFKRVNFIFFDKRMATKQNNV